MPLQLKIWGCRGSLPTPGPDTVTYGGNTSCVEVLLDGEAALVFDAGTGIRALGLDLVRRRVPRISLFLTHLHLDHLEGLRFFAPLWDPDVTVDVWGPRSPVLSLRERILRGFSPPLFPIDFRDVPARITFHDLPAEPWRTNGLSLASDLVLHPGPTVGFRLESGGSSVAYLPDHEPALVLISVACIVYGYVMKPLGLVVATGALVFISAFGGHEFKWKEVIILYALLMFFSWAVFVKGLTLPFPIWPEMFG